MRSLLINMGWVVALAVASCHSSASTEEAPETEVVTPVTITGVDTSAMEEYIEVNATSAFLQKAYIKASANGYIKEVNVQVNKLTSASQTAFVLVTKEAKSIGNKINVLDSSFKFSGVIAIPSGTSGYVTELNHQPGDYVQEGEQLAVVSDLSSFVFILNLPYEFRSYLDRQPDIALVLPDGKKLAGHIRSTLPQVDSLTQTQNITLSVDDKTLPANLIAKARLIKSRKGSVISLPKKAVLTDETQTTFWVVKLLDTTTAVKVPVQKGMEMGDRIEILNPPFSRNDRFVLTGNYGLPDTARIKIVEE